MIAFVLLVIGMLLIFIEFFLPGAVMGAIGILCILASIFAFASQAVSSLAVFFYFIAVCIVLFYVVRYAIWRMQRTGPQQTICSDDAQTGFVASSFDATVIGKQAIVLADLKPGGYIQVNGKKLQALSVSGYISQGDHVEIIGGQEESLIVKRIQKEFV